MWPVEGEPGLRDVLVSLRSFARRDLDRYRFVARAWQRLDLALLLPAVALAVLSGALGLAGVIDRILGMWMALAAAGLVGVRILLNPAQRARRAGHAATYLRLLASEIGIVDAVYLDVWPATRAQAAVVELRRWYRSISAVVANGADQLSPELLRSPLVALPPDPAFSRDGAE